MSVTVIQMAQKGGAIVQAATDKWVWNGDQYPFSSNNGSSTAAHGGWGLTWLQGWYDQSQSQSFQVHLFSRLDSLPSKNNSIIFMHTKFNGDRFPAAGFLPIETDFSTLLVKTRIRQKLDQKFRTYFSIPTKISRIRPRIICSKATVPSLQQEASTERPWFRTFRR